MIKTSLDWDEHRLRLNTQIQNLNYNPDLRKMLKNLDVMVTDLSKIEVEARRTKNTNRVNDQLAKIHSSIETLEQWIVMANLLQ